MTIGEALTWANRLLENKTESPRLDSEVLLSSILKKDKAFLLSHPEKNLSSKQKRKFNNLIEKREEGMPVAYLIKNKEFFKLNFYVDKRVLVPRPATEVVVDATYKIINEDPENFVVCDIGTGSGNIAVTLAKYFPKTPILASDISKDAIKVAKFNARRYKTKNIKFLHGDLWLPAESHLNKNRLLAQKKVLIIANLPYLTEDQINSNLKHEPEIALDGGEMGMGLYKELFKQIVLSNITPHHIYIEINPEQEVPTIDMQKNLLKIYERELINDHSGVLRYFHFFNLTE